MQLSYLGRLACAGVVGFCVTAGVQGRVVFSIDYSLDSGGLFDTVAARTAMDRAAAVLSDRLVDSLTAISPGSGNTWSPAITNPGTGNVVAAPLTSVAANVVKVFVGSRALDGTDIANTVAGSATASGSQSFTDNAASRGQPGALASPRTDYGPWGGSVAFDTATNWSFSLTTAPPVNKVDFLTVATHELFHLLGFSNSQGSFLAKILNLRFNGPKAITANGGVLPKLTTLLSIPPTPGSHWQDMSSTVGTGTASQVALMDAGLSTGVRRRPTLLDWAALDDLGWTLAMPGDANADGVVNFSDFQALELGFGDTNARWSRGDFNEDGLVDAADFSILLNNYGKRSNGTTLSGEASAVEAAALAAFASELPIPEPAPLGIALLLAGRMVTRRGTSRRA